MPKRTVRNTRVQMAARAMSGRRWAKGKVMAKASATPSRLKKPRTGVDWGASISGSKPPATARRKRIRV